ncbi:MAG: PAS domain S-box protein, partial [Candidatus Hodarchaeales archaeon]
MRELNCLYQIATIVERPEIPLPEICQEIVELLPPAWEYPDIAGAGISFEDQHFSTERFQPTPWIQTADIRTQGQKIGEIAVSYSEKRPDVLEDGGAGPFFREERRLIGIVAERLGSIIERKRAEKTLHASEAHYRTLFDSMGDAVFIHDLKWRFLEANQVACNRYGYTREEFLQLNFADLVTQEFLSLRPQR